MINKRIAKNTFFLYLRMMAIMGVTLYTSRVVLHVLGAEDFGLYNVVGGIIALFAFLNNAMVSATQRFITFEQASGSLDRQKNVYTAAIAIHLIIAIIVFIVSETVGVWFLNNKMNIPFARYEAANLVFQSAVISFMIRIMTVPFIASVIAHEKMKIYAYAGFVDALLQLLIVYLLNLILYDKLIVYSILVSCISLSYFMIYFLYCKNKFIECCIVKPRSIELYKSMLYFGGWSFLGTLGFSAKDYGVNILINIFCGASINAARAIAYQVQTAVNSLVSSFQTALNPQIVKTYSIGNVNDTITLVQYGSRISFILISIIIIPLIVRIDYVLNLWLVDVPPFTIYFLQLTLIMSVINSMFGPLVTAMQATGNIKLFQIVIAIIMFLDVPISYFILKNDLPPYYVMFVAILTAFMGLIARLLILNRLIKINVKNFILNIILKSLLLFAFWLLILSLLSNYIENTFCGLFIVIIFSFIVITISSLLFLLNKKERNFLYSKIIQHI